MLDVRPYPHTPGPCQYSRMDGVTDADGRKVLVDGVALPTGNHPRIREAEANARLLAAAFDYHAICTGGLIEVLERAATDLQRQGDRRICIELCKFAQRIREANIKAEGGPS